MLNNERLASQPKILPLNLNTILRLEKVILSQVHPDKFITPEHKNLSQETFKVVAAAYKCLEKGDNTWDSTYKPTQKIKIAGLNSDNKFALSEEVSLGSPLGFLNKVWNFLNVHREPENGSINLEGRDNSPNKNNDADIFKKQSESFKLFVELYLDKLKSKKIIFNIDQLDFGVDVSLSLIILITIIRLNDKVQNNSLYSIINSNLPPNKISLTKDMKGFLLEIRSNSSRNYTISIDTNYWKMIDTLIKKINDGTL